MKIYTKTGDTGQTGLYAGPRVRKDDPRIEAYGAVDELNATLGVCRCETMPAEIDDLLAKIQNTLFDLGAELATPNPKDRGTELITPAQIELLEKAIDHFEAGLAPLKTFILPGGTRAAALLHLARTICRRAERRTVTLADQPGANVSTQTIIYLNRLGDLLFVLARSANASVNVGDVAWRKS